LLSATCDYTNANGGFPRPGFAKPRREKHTMGRSPAYLRPRVRSAAISTARYSRRSAPGRKPLEPATSRSSALRRFGLLAMTSGRCSAWNRSRSRRVPPRSTMACQRWRTKARARKFSRAASSSSRLSSMTGRKGRRSARAAAKSPLPRRLRPGAVLTTTPRVPQLGDLAFRMNPQMPSAASSSTRRLAHLTIRSVWSTRLKVVSRRGAAGSPSRCIRSRGTPRPHSTSGQTATNRARAANTSATQAWRRLPPS